MASVALLLDKARARRSVPSDSALGEHLGKSRQTISQWRSGTTHPTDDDVLRLCQMAGEDCAAWLVRVAAERATSAPVAKAWETLAKRLGAAASLAAVALFLPYPASANAQDLQAEPPTVGCIMRSVAAFIRRVFGWPNVPAPVLA